jgi:hypothetical protein
MAMAPVADLRCRRRRRVAMAMTSVADLGRRRRLGRAAVAMMAIADLRRHRSRRCGMAVAMVTAAHHCLRRRDRVVMAVVDAGLRRAADKGDHRGDQHDRQALDGTDHSIS